MCVFHMYGKDIAGGCQQTVDHGYHQQGVRLWEKRLYFLFYTLVASSPLLVSHIYPKDYRFMILFSDPTLNPTKSNS